MNARPSLFVPLAALLAAGCASPGAIFVTKTSLAVADFDSTPAEMTVAMHRVEGFIAPRNRNGNTPPVLAHMRSNRAYTRPEVQQVYATGTAAERLAGDYKSNNSECTTCRKQDGKEGKDGKNISPVIFTTSTTLGLRIGVSTDNIVDGLVLGYRRKEMSFVPILAEDDNGSYRYPSLVAAIRITQPGSGQFNACQGFATGTAASKLAESDSAGFGCLDINESIKGLLTAKHSPELRQQAEVARVLSCYVALSDEQRKRGVRANAAKLGLFAAADPMVRTSSGLDLKSAGPASEDSHYVLQLLNAVVPATLEDHDSGASVAALREETLRAHREAVCAAVPEAPRP